MNERETVVAEPKFIVTGIEILVAEPYMLSIS